MADNIEHLETATVTHNENKAKNVVGDYEVQENSVGPFKNYLRNALFLTAIANLEWSRGYTWYVELDDVPFPFQRGGIIGLPVTDLTYDLCNPNTFEWSAGMEQFSAPQGKGLGKVNLTVLDDEQATIFTFFERWYNNIYNSRAGVLPVVEAAKCMSIYKLKATRTPVKRYTWRYDTKEQKVYGAYGKREDKKNEKDRAIPVDARELLVYPTGPLQEAEKGNESNPRRYTIDFTIVNHENPDYGNPAIHDGSFFDKATDGTSFLDKASHYF